MTKAREALDYLSTCLYCYDHEPDLIDVLGEHVNTITKALELLDKVERGGVTDINEHYCHASDESQTGFDFNDRALFNMGLNHIADKYILIERESDD